MAKLELFLLGSPQIFVAGQVITDFNTRKDQALLAYLAVTGTTHSRETLAGLLWSELPEEKARRNLRHALSHLQRVIGPLWLTTERGMALTQEQPWSVDVHTLESAIKNLTPHATGTATHQTPQTLDVLDQVLQLYRGEFLQGFHVHEAVYFEEWMLAQREGSRLVALRGLETLIEGRLAQGAYEQGLTATRRLLQLEPWSDLAHRLQMQLLAQSGRRTEALAQYEICRKVLAAELNVAPLPATTALYQQIRAGQYNPVVVQQPLAPPVAQAPKLPTIMAIRAGKASVPNNLLAPLAGFVGRQTELALISRRLGTSDCRLLTIVGPGGMGKTSLAQAAAQQLLQAEPSAFSDGIYFVALAGLESENGKAAGAQAGVRMATAIAECIGCDLLSGLPPQLQLHHYLRQRRLLLILDNFEHLLTATDTILALLTQAPGLIMLITSRARLNLRGETVLTLPKLSLPPATVVAPPDKLQFQQPTSVDHSMDNDGSASEAVAMFVQRAQCLDPHFTLNAMNLDPVTQICRLVDGLPLGIELATSMLPMLSCTALAQELTQSLAFLQAETHDLPQDQRTLRAVFARSWRLLELHEQTLLAKLAIFPATFHWEAAQAIAEATRPLLLRLINQSLINTTPDGRYVLHPLVRAFALEKLEQSPAHSKALRLRYAHFYLDFLAQNEPMLKGAMPTVATAQIYSELDNLRLAWRWAVTARLHNALLAGMHTLFLFYELEGLYAEGCEQAENALQPLLADESAQNQRTETPLNLLIGRLQTYLGGFQIRLGRLPQAENALSASLARLQHAANPFATALCLGVLGPVRRGQAPQQAKALLRAAVLQVQTSDDGWLRAWIYLSLGEVNHLLGDYAEAMAQYTHGYEAAKQTDCAWGLAKGQNLLGRLHVTIGDYQTGEAYLRDCSVYARRQEMKIIWIDASIYLGEALRMQGRLAEAQTCYTESRQQAETLQHKFLITRAIWGQASLAEQQGAYTAAQALFAQSMTTGHPNLAPYLPPTLGWALIGLGELAEAQRYFTQVVSEAPICQFPPITLDAEVGLAYIMALWTNASQLSVTESSDPTEPVAVVFQRVYRHPATTQETRDRIVMLAAALGIPLPAAPGRA